MVPWVPVQHVGIDEGITAGEWTANRLLSIIYEN